MSLISGIVSLAFTIKNINSCCNSIYTVLQLLNNISTMADKEQLTSLKLAPLLANCTCLIKKLQHKNQDDEILKDISIIENLLININFEIKKIEKYSLYNKSLWIFSSIRSYDLSERVNRINEYIDKINEKFESLNNQI